MATAAVVAIWLATDLACAGGTPLGRVQVSRWDLSSAIEGYLVARRCQVIVPLSWSLQGQIIARRVLVVHFADGAIEEYRISKVRRQVRSGIVSVEANGIELDLVERNQLITGTDAGLSVSTIITNRVLPALPAHFGSGTITPATLVNGSYSNSTPLGVLLDAVAAVYEATATRYEVSVRRNGTTNYLIDVTAYNAAALVPDMRTRKNIADLTSEQSTVPHATRVYAGTPGGFERATYVVSAVSAGAYIEVQDMAGGLAPAREDDQWNTTYYAVEWKNGTSHQITDTVRVSASTTRWHMSSTTGITAGEFVYLALVSGGVVQTVDSPALQATWKIKIGQVASIAAPTNLCGVNADLHDWTGSLPAGWGGSGTAPTKVTTAGLWQYGGQAALFDNVAFSTLQPPTQSVYLTAGQVVVVAALVRIEQSVSAHGLRFYDPNAGADVVVTLDGSLGGMGAYQVVSQQWTIASTGVKSVAMRLETGLGGGKTYLDGVAYWVLEPGTSEPTFRLGSGAAVNIAAANTLLDENGTPPTTFAIDAVDLYQANQTQWAGDPIDVGVSLAITDATLILTRQSLRVVSIQRSSDRPLNPLVTLSTLPSRITKTLATPSAATSGATTVVVGGSSGASSGQSAIQFIGTSSVAFTDGDTARRVTVTDAGVSGTSEIIVTVRRPDTAGDSADRGYLYTANIVRIGTGEFDVLLTVLGLSGEDCTANPPNETITLFYLVA